MKIKTLKSIVAASVAVAALAGVSAAQAMNPQYTGPRASAKGPQYVGPRASAKSPQFTCLGSKGALRVHHVTHTKAMFKPNPNGCR